MFPQNFLIFFLILALWVGDSPTREGPGYAAGLSEGFTLVNRLYPLQWSGFALLNGLCPLQRILLEVPRQYSSGIEWHMPLLSYVAYFFYFHRLQSNCLWRESNLLASLHLVTALWVCSLHCMRVWLRNDYAWASHANNATYYAHAQGNDWTYWIWSQKLLSSKTIILYNIPCCIFV